MNENQDQNENNQNQIIENDNNFIPILNYDPTNTYSLINISRDYMHQKKFNKALIYITLFLKAYPNSFDGYYIKSQIYTKLYIGNKALVLLNKALSLLKQQDDPEHTQELKILNCRGKCLIFLNRFDEAIETYQKINSYEANAKNYLKIGVCYYNKQNIDEAINNYNKAIELNPVYTEAYFNKGICLCNQKKKEEAIEVFNKAIEISNNDAELYLNRGYCYFAINNFRKAIKDFNKAIELRPNFSEAYIRKAACYQEMKKEEEALIEYKHAIEINDLHSKPMLFQAALYVSNYYKLKNNYEEALPYILKCAEYDEENELAQFNAGIAQMKMKKYDEAINFFNITLKINRTNVHAMFNKAICLMNIEKYDEAILIFSLLIQMNKKDFESHLYKGICFKKLGK